MPQLVIPGAVLIRLIWTLGGNDAAVNVMGARNNGAIPITQATADSLATAIRGSFGSSAMNAVISTQVALRTVGVRDINTPNQIEFLGAGAAVAGTAVGDMLPRQTCFTITLRTDRAGASYRGRNYFYGYTETHSDANGNPLALVQTNTLAFVTAVRANLTTAGFTMAVLSRPRAAEDGIPAYPGGSRDVQSVVSRALGWTTQRRRLIPGI